MHLSAKQLKNLTLVTKEKKARLAESVLEDSMKKLLFGVTESMKGRGEMKIETRVHSMRNAIADAFRSKYEYQYVEFFAYTLILGSSGEDDRHKYLDFPEPGAKTVLEEVVKALEGGQLEPDPDAVVEWVRQRVFSKKSRQSTKKPKGNLEE